LSNQKKRGVEQKGARSPLPSLAEAQKGEGIFYLVPATPPSQPRRERERGRGRGKEVGVRRCPAGVGRPPSAPPPVPRPIVESKERDRARWENQTLRTRNRQHHHATATVGGWSRRRPLW